MEPQFQPPISSGQNRPKRPNVFFLIGLVILLLLILAIFGSLGDRKSGGKENTVQTVIDLNTVEGRDKLPEGFPQELPVEIEGIVESSSTFYEADGVTSLEVSFLSSRSQSEIIQEYLSFVSQRAWQIYTLTDEPQNKSLYAKKGNSDISVTISPSGSKNLVNLSFLTRQ